MSKSISFLLGAGFSAPMGYPIGSTLNNLLLTCDGSTFGFYSDGTLVVSTDGTKPDFGYKTSYDHDFEFCKDLIRLFNKKRGYFDYEEFFDFYNNEAKNEKEVIKLFKSKYYGEEKSVSEKLGRLTTIYAQLISKYLVDSEGNSWYEDAAHFSGPSWQGYTGILNCLHDLSKDYLMNIHTLNHDLFFERLGISDWLQGELCDGFEELGSPYYGKLSIGKGRYTCRLQYYNGTYDKKFRLYKLHGSKDYLVYYSSQGGISSPDRYIKRKYGLGLTDLYKEVRDSKGQPTYENCWINYHPDFLTGTTSKIERYKEPLLYKILFQYFRENLKDAEKLIIIGYGGRDSEVNKMIRENFDFKNKPSFIIDPYPGKAIKELQNQIGAKLNININEFA